MKLCYIMKSVVRLFVVGALLLMTSCRPESFNIDYSIILESYEMSIYEPSGLSYSSDRQSLYTVSDRGMLCEISLTGMVIC